VSFVSTAFAIFAGAFFLLFFLTPGRLRLWTLLGGSYVFCAFFSPWFLVVLLASTAVNALLLRAMALRPDRSRGLMIAGVVGNVALLGVFKYLNFLRASYAGALTLFGLPTSYEALELLGPIGISFYTFQAISLLVDVNRRTLPPPKLFEVALLLGFWPKLIAGPIVRGTRLIPQMQAPRRFRWSNFWLGAEMVVYGLALKTMLADYLAPEVNKVYNSPASYAPADNLVAAFLYTFQIYGDFAGYSLMAIGFARVLGFSIGPNFRRPNFARSFSDFWQRWHISLSQFLGNYVYRSLPYKGPREFVRSRNTLITMLVSGLWHGPAWTFVAWGGMHGALLIIGREVTRWTAPLYRGRRWLSLASWPAQVLAVFTLVAVTRVFFRSGSIGEAWDIMERIAAGPIRLGDVQNKLAVLVSLAIVAGVTACEAVVEFGGWTRLKRRRAVRVGWALLVLLVTLVLGEFEGGQFVYVRF
jgi:D-alanyl-lipoteichoic acid acyltransferase DltB (MBOAT superfamily)